MRRTPIAVRPDRLPRLIADSQPPDSPEARGLSHAITRFAVVALAAVLPFAGGCNPAPKTASELDDGAAQAYWRGESELLRPGTKAVITDFAVEFVTEKYESPGENQAAFIPPSGPTIALGLAGVGLKQVEIDDAGLRQIAAAAYNVLLDDLAVRGVHVMPRAVVLETRRGGSYATYGDDAIHTTSQINFGGTDTGRIRRTALIPAPGGAVLRESGTRRLEKYDRQVNRQAGADVALRVRLRAGVYRGAATFEQGSEIWLTSGRRTDELRSTRSLRSEIQVITADSTGSKYIVSVPSYLTAMDRTLPTYIDWAFGGDDEVVQTAPAMVEPTPNALPSQQGDVTEY